MCADPVLFIESHAQQIKDFLNSAFVAAFIPGLISSLAGAGFGAWGAQKIATAAKLNDDRINEISNTNAAKAGRILTAYVLRQKGAAVDPTEDKHGYTPLHLAAACAHTELVKLLLHYGAKPRATTKDGRTAIDLAREYINPDIVETLQNAMDRDTATAEPLPPPEHAAPKPFAKRVRPGDPEAGARRRRE